MNARDWAAIGAIVLLAAAIRLGASNYSLWYDETAAVKFAEQPLSLLWSNWAARETNPPLYYTFLHFWISVFGEGDIAVRSLSIMIGVVSIAMLYRVAMALTGSRTAALVAAMLSAVSGPHVHYSLEARGFILAYAGVLVALAGIIELWWRHESDASRDRTWPLLQYVLGSAVALYSHTTLIFVVAIANLAVIGLCLFHPRRPRELIPGWIVANAALALIWAWWGWITFRQATGHNANIAWLTAPTAKGALDSWRNIFLPFHGYLVPMGFEILVALVFVHALWRGAYRNGVLLMAGSALAIPAALFVVSQIVPIYLPKTLFPATSLFTLALAAAVAGLPARPRLAVIGLLLAGSISQVAAALPHREVDHWDKAAEKLLTYGPTIPILVADEGVAIAVDHYCRRKVRSRCPLDIRLVEPRPDWAFKLSGYPRINAVRARELAARSSYVTVSWDWAPVDVLRHVPAIAGRRAEITPLGTTGRLAYWPRAAGRQGILAP